MMGIYPCLRLARTDPWNLEGLGLVDTTLVEDFLKAKPPLPRFSLRPLPKPPLTGGEKTLHYTILSMILN